MAEKTGDPSGDTRSDIGEEIERLERHNNVRGTDDRLASSEISE